MRILFIQRAWDPGGSSRSLQLLASELAGEHDIRLMTIGPARYAPLYAEAGLTLEPLRRRVFEQGRTFAAIQRLGLRRGAPTLMALPRLLLDGLPSVLAVARAVRRIRPDVVHVNESLRMNRPEIVGAALARRPVVVHVRQYHEITAVDRRVARLVSRFVAISHSIAGAYEDGGIPRDRIDVVDNPVEPPPAMTPAERTALRAELGLEESGVWAVTAGRLIAWKGIEQALEAVALLRSDGMDVRIVVAGEGDDRAALEARAAELGLDGAARFLGWRSDVMRVIASADVLLLPSQRPEPFGRAAIEGLACGLPVVATGFGGSAELVEGGRTGTVVHEHGGAAIADALRPLAADAALRRRMSAECRRVASDRFGPERHATLMLEILRRAAT